MKTLRALVGVAVLVGIVYVGLKIVPPYFHAYQFEDVVAEEARLGTYSTKSESDIREIVAKRAADLDLPVQPEQIVVNRSSNSVDITVDYTVHIDLPGYPLDLKFHTASKNRGI
jgi:hypothetical protein